MKPYRTLQIDSTEIAKRAIYSLLEAYAIRIRDVSHTDCDNIDAWNCLEFECRLYIEAYDYAKSIGAIQ